MVGGRFGRAGGGGGDGGGPLESASYVLVTAVGLWLFAAQLRRRPQAGHGHNHSHDHDGCGHHHLPDPVLRDRQARGGLLGKAGALVLAVGIRPCSGAVLMLLFALAHGAFFAGVAATFAMALGTAITVSALAILTLYSKRLPLPAARPRPHWA